ncbi:hypothetical protein C8F01DRAFT_1253454 [Mycena amicta]|nr:hypothetical protein C8F01DRAFT_1253454 [Mycena amicta]
MELPAPPLTTIESPAPPLTTTSVAEEKCSRCRRAPITTGFKTCAPCRTKHTQSFRQWRKQKEKVLPNSGALESATLGKRKAQVDESLSSATNKRLKPSPLQTLSNSSVPNNESHPVSNPPATFQKFTWASNLYSELQSQYSAKSGKKTFRFHGTHSIIADPALNNKRRARQVERDLKTHAGLQFRFADRIKHREGDAYTITHRCSCLPTPKNDGEQGGCAGRIVIYVADDHSHPLGWLGQRVKISVTHPKTRQITSHS